MVYDSAHWVKKFHSFIVISVWKLRSHTWANLSHHCEIELLWLLHTQESQVNYVQYIKKCEAQKTLYHCGKKGLGKKIQNLPLVLKSFDIHRWISEINVTFNHFIYMLSLWNILKNIFSPNNHSLVLKLI